MANRFTVGQVWGLLKGRTLIGMHVLMSGTTPVLQRWVPPTLNSGTAGSYVAAATTATPQGGVGTASIGSEGVASVARTAAGLWTVTLQDRYTRLLSIEVMQSLPGGLSTISEVGNNTTITNMTPATATSGSIIGCALLSSSATAADPADTTVLDIVFSLQNSSAL